MLYGVGKHNTHKMYNNSTLKDDVPINIYVLSKKCTEVELSSQGHFLLVAIKI